MTPKWRKYEKKERKLLTIIVILSVFMCISIVYSQAQLAKSNIEVEKLKSKVDKQKRENESLSMQIDELASLSNIQEVAKNYGLSYNNDNIIVIESK